MPHNLSSLLAFMENKTAIRYTAWTVSLLAGMVLLYFLYTPPPSFNDKPHVALGEVIGEETAKLVGNGGRVILIIRDTRVSKNPAVQAQVKSLQQTLQKRGIRLGPTNALRVDPLRVASVPPGDFFTILKKGSELDVVVSFLGPPALTADQMMKLDGKQPKVVAVCSGNTPRQVNLKRLFDAGLLHLAVVSRENATKQPPAQDSTRAWFDHLYTVVRGNEAADVAAPSPAAR